MNAGIYLGKENIEVREIETPVIGDDDVLIKNIYSSICGTDVAVFTHGPNTGHRVTVGGEFGHETVSRVAAVGKNVMDIHVGDRVYPYPLYAINDTRRAGTLGGFSEYILCPKAKINHSLYLVPKEITDKEACLIEPFTVGCRAAKRCLPKISDHAVVFGCGTIGLAAAITLKWLGTEEVLICDFSALRLKIAENLGFYTCNLQSEDYLKKSETLWGKSYSISEPVPDIDTWLDAAGADSILDDFMKNGKVEAKFVTVAVNNNLRSIDMLRITYSSQSISGSGGYRPEDVQTVMNIMSSHRWNIEHMITSEFPLSKLSEAIQEAADSQKNLNVIINFEL